MAAEVSDPFAPVRHDQPRIPLVTQTNRVTGYSLLDMEDVRRLGVYRWRRQAKHAGSLAYACRSVRTGCRVQMLHREVAGLAQDDPLTVDHINRDPLDNRRCNLRICTMAENHQNKGTTGGSSRYRGVSWWITRGCWTARVKLDGKTHHLGYFDDEDEAGAAAIAFRKEHLPFANN